MDRSRPVDNFRHLGCYLTLPGHGAMILQNGQFSDFGGSRTLHFGGKPLIHPGPHPLKSAQNFHSSGRGKLLIICPSATLKTDDSKLPQISLPV